MRFIFSDEAIPTLGTVPASTTVCPNVTVNGGYVNITGLTPGSTAEYTCPEGFFLVEESIRLCLHSGEWSGKEPKCVQGI